MSIFNKRNLVLNQNIAKGRNQFEAKSKTGGADHIVLTVNILWQLWKARNDSVNTSTLLKLYGKLNQNR